MKISRIEISNFRGIEQLALDLINPFTGIPLDLVVLAGPNGCGKTSVLESIVISLTDRKGKDDKAFSKRNNRDSKDYSISIKVLDGDNDVTISNTPGSNGESQRLKRAFQNRVEYFSSWREPLLKGPLSVTLGKKGNRPQDVEINRLWNLKQFLIDSYVADNLSQNMDLISSRHQDAMARMKKALSKFYLGGEIELKIMPVSDNIEDGFDVLLKYPNSAGRFVSLDNLSSGEIELFSFLSAIIRKDLTNGILIIDEPELHLHISWHRIIMSALVDLLPNTQIICATHSIEIIESVKSYELFVIKSDNDYRNPMRGAK